MSSRKNYTRGPFDCIDSDEGEEESHEKTMDPREPLSSAFDATDSIISVYVGTPNVTVFHVHSKKLSSSSHFFQLKSKPHWKGNGDCVELPDLLPDAFLIYSSWLYTGAIHTTTNIDDNTDDQTHIEEFRRLAIAYVLGEYLQDPKFKDSVMDSLLSKLRGDTESIFFQVGAEMVRTVYQGTPATSPARLLMADLFTNHAGERYMRNLVGEVPADFLQDLAIAFAAKKFPQALTLVRYDASKYHRQKLEKGR